MTIPSKHTLLIVAALAVAFVFDRYAWWLFWLIALIATILWLDRAYRTAPLEPDHPSRATSESSDVPPPEEPLPHDEEPGDGFFPWHDDYTFQDWVHDMEHGDADLDAL